MAGILCNMCSREVSDEEDINVCLNCGAVVCKDDYDSVSGFCANCSENGPYEGC